MSDPNTHHETLDFELDELLDFPIDLDINGNEDLRGILFDMSKRITRARLRNAHGVSREDSYKYDAEPGDMIVKIHNWQYGFSSGQYIRISIVMTKGE